MGGLIDETGSEYGRLTVIKRTANEGTNAAWLCQCICGNTVTVRGSNLRGGNTKSCGCLLKECVARRRIDETGHRYGRLVVDGRADKNKRRATLWLCRCDCGNTTVVEGCALRTGNTKSCGCLRREMAAERGKVSRPSTRKLPQSEAAFNNLFSRMKRGARARGYAWMLKKGQVQELTQQPCHYCGAAPTQVCQGRYGSDDYIYNGLDRVDNKQGYEIGNVVSCCGDCNRAKLERSTEDFGKWLVKAYHYFAESVYDE